MQANILIVDDRSENLLTLESLIAAPAIELTRAGSGEEALAKMLDKDFALVLLDVQMPGMDGYEVAELMRGNKQTRHLPIIFITAGAPCEQKMFKGYEAGAVDFLFKPLNPLILKSKVNIFIELFRQKVELEKKTVELDQKLADLEALQQQLEEANEQLQILSVTDGLTGLLNKRKFDYLMTEEWNRAFRNQSELAVILLDIDHFKAYNDTYGHLGGDDCLRKVTEIIAESVMRDIDKTARIGGEEFAVLLPQTNRQGALHVAEKIRQNIEQAGIPHAGSETAGVVTCSFGVATVVPEDKTSYRDLIAMADKALYMAKSSGRNRVASVDRDY